MKYYHVKVWGGDVGEGMKQYIIASNQILFIVDLRKHFSSGGRGKLSMGSWLSAI